MLKALPPFVTVDPEPRPGWDAFVERSAAASVYHVAAWPTVLADTFGLQAFYVSAQTPNSGVVGVLPLVRQKSRMFGDRLTSLPFVNYGGAIADGAATRSALMERAVGLGRELGVDRVEFRDSTPPPSGWSCRSDKVTLRLPLPSTLEALSKGFGSKLRSQIRRAEHEAVEVRVGGRERVTDFYPVFAEVMRDLGTPVYPRRFFEQIAERLPTYCTILTLHRSGRPVAGAFLVGYRDTVEVPWAATISAERPSATNMLLYAEALRLAVQRGYKIFDFGRSTIDSGPYRFKRQWGAEPLQLHWAVWPTAEPPGDGPNNASLQSRATRIWARLPLAVANRLGPLISPQLPW